MAAMVSAAALQSAGAEYQEQLRHVEFLLVEQPGDAELLQVRAALVEVLGLTEELLATTPDVLEAALGDEQRDNAPAREQDGPPATTTEAPKVGPAWVGQQGSGAERQADAKEGDPRAQHCNALEQPGRNVEEEFHPGPRKRRQMHPRNKYAETPPDFDQLAAKFPSLAPFVYHNAAGRPNIEWTDFNASRELTRALLAHDHVVSWWIPDGQLCPTVTSRANYLHWIQDLLHRATAPWHAQGSRAPDCASPVIGLDIGVGANCIYPLLGASLTGWRFVGTDVTPVALTWAQKNVDRNPHLAPRIEIRAVAPLDSRDQGAGTCSGAGDPGSTGQVQQDAGEESSTIEGGGESSVVGKQAARDDEDAHAGYVRGAAPETNEYPILEGVLRPGERFDFCMCNPPFFESMAEASANPRTALGGTAAEMVYPGGEEAFVGRMVEESGRLQGRVHWYTSMLGKKASLKKLTAALRSKRVAAVETTEFVQGRTSRWGLAWSFTPRKVTAERKAAVAQALPPRSKLSFTLQRLGRHTAAWSVLQAIREELEKDGAACDVNEATFVLQARVPASSPGGGAASDGASEPREHTGRDGRAGKRRRVDDAQGVHSAFAVKVSVFQQAPGTLLVSAALSGQQHPLPITTAFGILFDRIQEKLRTRLTNT